MDFKDWSFRLFLYKIVLETYLLILYFYTPIEIYIGKRTKNTSDNTAIIFQIFSYIFLLTGILFLIISVIRKEEKNSKFYIAAIGFSLFLIVSIISLIIK